MQTRLIEVMPDEESWTARGTRAVRTHRLKALAIVGAVPIVAIAAIPTAFALVGTAVASIMGDLWIGGRQVEQVPLKEASLLRGPDGDPPISNQIYAFHPDRSLETLIIPASAFHSFIVSEQIAHLVAYIRGIVAAEDIRIAVYSENGAKVAVTDHLTRGSGLGIKAHAGSARHHSVELHYDVPVVVCSEGVPFWIRAFPDIKAAFHGATKGSVNRSFSVDTSFGLTMSLAKSAGIDANWLGKQRFEIDVRFG